MGGPVELIVLSPAPEDEDDLESSSEVRTREQELWRRARIVPVATRLLQRRFSQGTESSLTSSQYQTLRGCRPKSNSSGDIGEAFLGHRKSKSRICKSRQFRRSISSGDFASKLPLRSDSVLEAKNTSVQEARNTSVQEAKNTSVQEARNNSVLEARNNSVQEASKYRAPKICKRPLKSSEGAHVDKLEPLRRTKKGDARSNQPIKTPESKMSDSLAPPDAGSAASPEPGSKGSPGSGRASPTTSADDKSKSDKVMDSEDTGKSKSGGEPSAHSSHSRPKPVVEDRALQALLASRRRSLENAGKPEPRRKKEGQEKNGEGEEEESKKNISEEAAGTVQQPSHPPPWMKFEVGGVAGLGQTKSDNVRKAKTQTKKKEPTAGGSVDEGDEENRAKGKMISKFFATELRQKRKLMGHLGAPGKEEIYCDKDRAAAVAMGDQDIKTSLKVKRKKERKTVQPEDTNSSVHMTEALRAISKGNVETALSCAEKAVEGCQDPGPLVVRGRCHLLLGHLQHALEDARTALKADPTLVKAVLVQAEALYGMGEFERSLVLFHRGARKRPDLSAFKRGVHKAREAIINAIGAIGRLSGDVSRGKGDKFPDIEDPMTATTLSDGSASRSSVPTITVNDPKGSKMASKRLLGGLSSDKEFLASLVNRRSLTRELHSTFSTGPVGKSGIQVAAVAKEALSSLQHLESFMWQRDPGGSMNTGGDKTTLQKSREKKEKARLKASLRKRVAAVLEKLQQEEDLEVTVREGETLVNEVKAMEVGDRVLCRLLVGLGVAFPNCGRPQDAIAVLTDAVHIARANEFGDEEHSAVEQLGRVLAEQGQHAEAVAVWERRIPAAANSSQRASLFLLIAKSYFAMRKVETGKFYGTKSVREADDDQDNTTALTALLALVDADVKQENIEGAQKNLEKCCSLLEDAPRNLLDEYESFKVKIAQFTEETPS